MRSPIARQQFESYDPASQTYMGFMTECGIPAVTIEAWQPCRPHVCPSSIRQIATQAKAGLSSLDFSIENMAPRGAHRSRGQQSAYGRRTPQTGEKYRSQCYKLKLIVHTAQWRKNEEAFRSK